MNTYNSFNSDNQTNYVININVTVNKYYGDYEYQQPDPSGTPQTSKWRNLIARLSTLIPLIPKIIALIQWIKGS